MLRIKRVGIALLIGVSTFGSSRSAVGQCELGKVVSSFGATSNEFGRGVVADGDFLVVVNRYGQNFVYERAFGTNFSERWYLTSSGGPSLNGLFSISGNRIVAGATGLAYVFEFDGNDWEVAHQLAPADDYFALNGMGTSPSINGDVIVLGAPYAPGPCPGPPDCASGAAYVFRWNGVDWIEEQRLVASTPTPGDAFGRTVAIGHDRILIGALGGNGFTGSAHVFDWNGSSWVQQAELIPSDGFVDGWFSTSLALEGDMAVVGATHDMGCPFSIDPCEPGVAFVYELDGAIWSETQVLRSTNAVGWDRFGLSMALEGDTLVVGADHGSAGDAYRAGAGFLYRREGDTWVEEAVFTASDANSSSEFAGEVAMSNGLAFIGAIGADGAAHWSGAVYVFGVDGDCDEDGEIDTCEILANPTLDANGNLILDTCDPFIPAVSTWGLVVLTLLLLTAGSALALRGRHRMVQVEH